MVYAVSAGQLWLPTEPLTVLVRLVGLCDLAKVKANKFNSLTVLWEETFMSQLTDTCSGSNFIRLKVAHEHLATQSSEVNSPFWDWVGFAVWEVQNGNYFLPIKPHSPPRKTCTELTLQLVVTTSVTATVMKTPLIFTSYPDVTSMNLSKLDALLFLAVMWLMGVAQQKENGSYMKKCQRQHLWNFLSNHVMIAWTWHHWWIFQMYLFGV